MAKLHNFSITQIIARQSQVKLGTTKYCRLVGLLIDDIVVSDNRNAESTSYPGLLIGLENGDDLSSYHSIDMLLSSK